MSKKKIIKRAALSVGGILLLLIALLAGVVAGVVVPNGGEIYVSDEWHGLDDPAGPGIDVVLTANAEGGTVTVLDDQKFEQINEIDVIPDGSSPPGWFRGALSPVVRTLEGVNYAQHIEVFGGTLFVARGYLADVVAFDIATGELQWSVPVPGLRADHMRISTDGSQLFVSATTADEVLVIDPNEPRVTGRIETGTFAHGSELSHDESRFYVASLGNLLMPSWGKGEKTLTIADTDTLEVVDELRLDDAIRPFVVAPDGETIFAQLSEFHGVAQIDLETGGEIARVDLPIPDEVDKIDPGDYDNEAAHHGLALSGDGSTLCAAGTVSDYVALVDTDDLSVREVIDVGDEPGWTTTSMDGERCYVGNRGTDTVTVIDFASGDVVATVAVGDRPQHVMAVRIPA